MLPVSRKQITTERTFGYVNKAYVQVPHLCVKLVIYFISVSMVLLFFLGCIIFSLGTTMQP